MSPRSFCAALVALTAALEGCASDDVSEAPESSSQESHPEFISIDSEIADAFWASAHITGRLRLSEECLVVAHPAVTLVAVWPAEYTWTPETGTVSWRAGESWPSGEVQVGDQVSFGGGTAPDSWRTQTTDRHNRPLLTAENIEQIETCLESTGADSWSFLTPPES